MGEGRGGGAGAGDAEIEYAGGRRAVLMVEGSVHLPDLGVLLVADLHLGKAGVFGAAGIPIPGGVDEEQLSRLSRAVSRSGAGRVVVLGDLLHAPAGVTGALVERVSAWRGEVGCEVGVVVGNHDREIERVARTSGIEVLGGEWVEGGVGLVHDAEGLEDDGRAEFWWAGHVHPCVRLASGADAMKLGCFWIRRREGVGVLPAWSRFTGGAVVRASVGDECWVVAQERVVRV